MSKELIEAGKAVMGLEFGSTRIKAVLIDEEYKVIAQGNHDWENRLKNGIWTYSEDDIWDGLRDAY
ncbi:MAG: ATPase, partial [Lachnospiraceae bacterium]|nr:ATPase [Lachnospiraceae bacterium]